MLTHWQLNENSFIVACPCREFAVGRFVLPTDDKKLLVVCTCPACYADGNPPTTLAYLDVAEEDWAMLVLSLGFTAKRRNRG